MTYDLRLKRKPIIINAIKWTGNNKKDLEQFFDYNEDLYYFSYINKELILLLDGASNKKDVVIIGQYIVKEPDGFKAYTEEMINALFERI